jgi:hypothetical protein
MERVLGVQWMMGEGDERAQSSRKRRKYCFLNEYSKERRLKSNSLWLKVPDISLRERKQAEKGNASQGGCPGGISRLQDNAWGKQRTARTDVA